MRKEATSDLELSVGERHLLNERFKTFKCDKMLGDRDLNKLKVLLTLCSELRDEQVLRREIKCQPLARLIARRGRLDRPLK